MQSDKNKWSGFIKWQQALDADSFYSALIEVNALQHKEIKFLKRKASIMTVLSFIGCATISLLTLVLLFTSMKYTNVKKESVALFLSELGP